MKKLAFAILLSFFAIAAYAQTPGIGGTSDSDIVNMVAAAIQRSADSLLVQSARYLSLFMLVQFIITNWKFLPTGDIDSLFAKFIGSLFWFGFCWYVLDQGPGFIKAVGNQFWREFAGQIPTPGVIIASTAALVMTLVGVATLIGGSLIGQTLGNGVMALAFLVGGAGAFFAFKAFLLQIEILLVAFLSPLSFSMLGLNALRDQGIAPLKSLVALVYRIVIYGVIFVALFKMFSVVMDVLDQYTSLNSDTVDNLLSGGKVLIGKLMSAIVGEFLLVFLLWKADGIAAGLASGSSSLNTSDVAGAAAAGAAAALAGVSAGQALAKPGQSIMDLMGAASASLRNASSSGRGGLDGLEGGLAKPDLGGVASLGGNSGPGDTGNSAVDQEAAATEKQLGPNPNEFKGQPNPLPQEGRDTSRDAARDARRAARSGGSGSDAAISGGDKTQEALGQIANALQGKQPGFRDRLAETNRHVAQEAATTHVSISTHHD